MTKDAHDWSNWFWESFFPRWLTQVQDAQGGVFDRLDINGMPHPTEGKSLLAQARTLFTVSHVAQLTGDPALVAVARRQADFLTRFQKAPGLYRNKLTRDGTPTGLKEDEVARSYDQTFVILGLVTWDKIAPSNKTRALIEACWKAIETHLTDRATGLLLNDDSGAKTGPAQNPHMHLYEACLQGFRMTQDAIWLTRAADMRKNGIEYFLDPNSGSIAEFLTPGLQALPGAAGQRREVGHQCEWAWLLQEEAELANDATLSEIASRLFGFAYRHGFATDGPLKGAVFDAVSADGDVVENQFLLWPQTEAIKLLATRHRGGDPTAAARAQSLVSLMFAQWFEKRPVFCNQLDAVGKTLWDEALTRLMYHLVLAMSEGTRAGILPALPAKII